MDNVRHWSLLRHLSRGSWIGRREGALNVATWLELLVPGMRAFTGLTCSVARVDSTSASPRSCVCAVFNDNFLPSAKIKITRDRFVSRPLLVFAERCQGTGSLFQRTTIIACTRGTCNETTRSEFPDRVPLSPDDLSRFRHLLSSITYRVVRSPFGARELFEKNAPLVREQPVRELNGQCEANMALLITGHEY